MTYVRSPPKYKISVPQAHQYSTCPTWYSKFGFKSIRFQSDSISTQNQIPFKRGPRPLVVHLRQKHRQRYWDVMCEVRASDRPGAGEGTHESFFLVSLQWSTARYHRGYGWFALFKSPNLAQVLLKDRPPKNIVQDSCGCVLSFECERL